MPQSKSSWCYTVAVPLPSQQRKAGFAGKQAAQPATRSIQTPKLSLNGPVIFFLLDGPARRNQITSNYIKLPSFTESSQAESVGLGRTSPTKVDFNCDGDTDDTTNIDLNPKDDSGSNTSTDTLTDYNDWANITIVFNETYSGQTRSLRNFSESNYNNEVILHPIYDHLQPVAEEFDPPKSFFEELNKNLRLNVNICKMLTNIELNRKGRFLNSTFISDQTQILKLKSILKTYEQRAN